MKPSNLRLTLVILAAALGCGCRSPERLAGGTTDTGNAISSSVAGIAVDTAGRPVPGARVRLRSADYLAPLPSLMKRGITDFDGGAGANGAFAIEDIDSGRYRLELIGIANAKDGDTGWADAETSLSAILDLDLSRPGSLPEFRFEAGRATLARMGRVTGAFSLRPGSRRAFVQVYGLERLAQTEAGSNRFAIGLPAGRFVLRFTDPECGSPCLREWPVAVEAGSALDIGEVDMGGGPDTHASWAHSARITLDIPATAGPDLAGFPLLVRLDSGSFNFAQARPDGSDVRFTSGDGGAELPHQIESWDSAAGRAALWVRLAPPQGGSASIRMYWGNASVTEGGRFGDVFDTDRFAAVWHLGEAQGEGTHRDATPNGNHGVDSAGAAGTFAADGVAGAGRAFAAGTAGIRVADAPSLRLGADDFGISAWVRDAGGAGTRQVLCKRTPTSDYELQMTAEGRAKGFAGRNPGIASVTGSQGAADGQWHLLDLVRSGDSLIMYRDGERDTATAAGGMGDADNAADLFLGRDPGKATGEAWLGDLDEVRILRGAPSPDWIRLGYRTQAPGSGALHWSRLR